MSNFLNNKLQVPNDELLVSVLGDTKELLDAISTFIETEFGSYHSEWKFYGAKIGWSLKLFHKKRNVVFVGPEDGYFRLAFALGQKATNDILDSNIPEAIKQQLSASKVYMEGRQLLLEIRTKQDLEPLWEIIRAKLRY